MQTSPLQVKHRLINVSVIITLTILFLIGYGVVAHNKNVISPLQKNISGVTKETAYLIDKDNSHTIDWIYKNFKQFIPATNNKVPYTLSDESYWVSITLTNQSNTQRSITLFTDNFVLKVLNAYSISESNKLSPSLIYQLNDKKLLDSYYPHIPILLEAKQQAHFLFHLQSDAAPQMTILLADQSAFERLTIFTVVLSTVFVAIVVLMILYNLIIYFAVKDNVYLFYIGYLVSALIVLASINGFGRYIFPLELHLWFNEYTLIFHYLLAICLILFTLYFLQYNDYKSWLYKASIALCGIMVIAAVSGLFFSHVIQAKIFFSLQAIFYFYFKILHRLIHLYL